MTVLFFIYINLFLLPKMLKNIFKKTNCDLRILLDLNSFEG